VHIADAALDQYQVSPHLYLVRIWKTIDDFQAISEGRKRARGVTLGSKS